MRAKRSVRRRSGQRGMSLVEIMVVITIMALVMGAVAVAVFPMFKKASCTNSWNEAHVIQNAIVQYRSTNGSGDCPSSIQDLRTLLTKEPMDPWGKPYNFKCPGEHDEVGDVWSSGPDKNEGTPDDVKAWVRVQEQCK